MFAFILTLLLHPFHETVAEVQWNPESRRMEVALRLDLLDHQWIRRHHGDASRAGSKKPDRPWQLEYLRPRFRFYRSVDDTASSADGERGGASANGERASDRVRYRWVGQKLDGAHIWWFFEVEPASGERPREIGSRLLADRDDRYTHRITVLGVKPRRAFALTDERPRAPLDANRDGDAN